MFIFCASVAITDNFFSLSLMYRMALPHYFKMIVLCVSGPDLPDRCLMPSKDVGRCRAMIERWSFNIETNQCEQFFWGGCGANETNNFINKVECEMSCKPECPIETCSMECEYGFVQDENGCNTCECNKCAPYMCMMYCEHGFVQNEDGCDVCECRDCPLEMCAMYCEHGFEQDEHGCDICKCKGEKIHMNNFQTSFVLGSYKVHIFNLLFSSTFVNQNHPQKLMLAVFYLAKKLVDAELPSQDGHSTQKHNPVSSSHTEDAAMMTATTGRA